jgi:RNA polymerase sigma-70 factor (ECF subfamily)
MTAAQAELFQRIIVHPVRAQDAPPNRNNQSVQGEQAVDRDLVERALAGEPRAFELLVRKYQHKVIKLVTRYLHDPVESEDVAQEVFVRAWRALGNFRGDSAFYTWLYRIAVNTAKNHLVAQQRRPPDSEIDAHDAEQYQGESALKEYATPERLVLAAEIERTVFAALSTLPEDLRSALTLREMEGLTYEEIAAVMDCPIGTVRSRIFRAREAIDEQLRPLLGPDE